MQNNDKLISANALLEKVQFRVELKGVVGATIKDTAGITRKLIDEAPAVDAVKVVRCKDCKHWLYTGGGMGDCTNGRFHLDGHVDPTMYGTDYCSCAERRTTGGS